MSSRFARVPVQAAGARLLGARALRVLIAIAAHADRDGRAYPSLACIAEITGVARSKLPAEIRALAAAGLLRCERRQDQAGDSAPNLYTVMFEAPEVSPQAGTPVPATGDTVSPQAGAPGVPSHGDQTERLLTNHLTDTARHAARQSFRNFAHDPFEDFWRVYPSRGEHPNPQKPARQKFAALLEQGVDPAAIIAGADRYRRITERNRTDQRFIAQATTFLSQERFDEPLEASAQARDAGDAVAIAARKRIRQLRAAVAVDRGAA